MFVIIVLTNILKKWVEFMISNHTAVRKAATYDLCKKGKYKSYTNRAERRKTRNILKTI